MTGDGKSAKHTNRLARESSPYLLQHAHNPVDWFAWGDEAFAEAKRRDVPVFLSIGYSTCYWCHVMERESFENAEIAAIMNERFVCVKVDREERPAVDELYMAATTITTGHGGWPMSVFLEPGTLKPIYCGTYFPAKAMPGLAGRPTFPQVLTSISDLWQTKRAEVMAQAQQVADAVIEQVAGAVEVTSVGRAQVADAASVLLRIFDSVDGGFSRAPKFPQPVFLEFLLDVRAVMDGPTRATVDHALRHTLDAMACGGIFDQVGGGFHRYSVDAHWIVPHFEKMLYDQAQLAAVYTRASQEFQDPFYAHIARRTLDFVLREMTHESGAFFSAIDAEVDAKEGLNYLWQAPEFDAALGCSSDAAFAREVYGVDAGPNFKDPHHLGEPARSVLRLAGRPEKVAERMGLTPGGFAAKVEDINEQLLAFRNARPQPRLDDKVLASWNGLMIGAFAAAGAALNEPRYIEAARRAMAFVLESMRDSGRLIRSWRGKRGESSAVLEDYASVVHGLAALARAVPAQAAEYLSQAHELTSIAEQVFGDGSGALSDAPTNSRDLFARLRSSHDGATPSAVSVLMNAWLDLAAVSGDGVFVERTKRLLASISGKIAESPISTVNSTRALLRLLLTGDVPPGEDHASNEDAPSAQADEFTPVEVYADVDRVSASSDVPGSLKLFVRIAKGYHIIAADPGGEVRGLVPFRVGIVHGKGVAAYADYPAGSLYGVPGAGQIRVYEGEFELPIVVDVEGEWTGTPLLSVSYQACTDTECLRPRIAEIDVAIDRG